MLWKINKPPDFTFFVHMGLVSLDNPDGPNTFPEKLYLSGKKLAYATTKLLSSLSKNAVDKWEPSVFSHFFLMSTSTIRGSFSRRPNPSLACIGPLAWLELRSISDKPGVYTRAETHVPFWLISDFGLMPTDIWILGRGAQFTSLALGKLRVYI